MNAYNIQINNPIAIYAEYRTVSLYPIEYQHSSDCKVSNDAVEMPEPAIFSIEFDCCGSQSQQEQHNCNKLEREASIQIEEFDACQANEEYTPISRSI